MSRIGKQPVMIPGGVTVAVETGRVSITGPKGTLELAVPSSIIVEQKENALEVSLRHETKQSRKTWGTIRSHLANMVKGVTEGFDKKLEIEGVGYRAALVGKDLELRLGFSHPVKVSAAGGIEFKVEKNTITVFGVSKEDVGRVAGEIRALKKPEPYKGKGIHYVGEVIRRKAGKKATTTA